MKQAKVKIGNIPAIVWDEETSTVYLYVHGKMADKESARQFAEIAKARGYQTLSFDLPRHGERKDEEMPCDIWNGIKDLASVAEYAKRNWKTINLFACSMGAFFSLHAYKNLPFGKCLFQSPIVDMEHLIHKMMAWFDVSETELKEKGKIETPVDVLDWDYYCYVKENPIESWTAPTEILYASEDNLQGRDVMESFAKNYGCELTVSEGSEHSFMQGDGPREVERWLMEHI